MKRKHKAPDQTFLDGKVSLYAGDCLAMIRHIETASIDSVVTDPPYALVSISKRFSKSGRTESTRTKSGPHQRTVNGFMGKKWDTGEVAHAKKFWKQVYRVLKPGGHVVAFGGTRTYHRLATAIEDAGFEIRDQLGWAYGSGFPKSHDVPDAIDEHFFLRWLGDHPKVRARMDKMIAWAKKRSSATLARNIRIAFKTRAGFVGETIGERYTVKRIKAGATVEREGEWGKQEVDYTATDRHPATAEALPWVGWGTALKPAWEPICLARKPIEGTVAANVLAHGTGALNIDGCRVPAEGNAEAIDRWPANILHDGSDEVLACFPDSDGQAGAVRPDSGGGRKTDAVYGAFAQNNHADPRGDSGSAARFFYSSKADAEDRLGSKHPTIKPLDVKQWLVRMTTPRGGITLDPFAGTGTTGEAAFREGMRAILIELEPEYQADIAKRMDLAERPTKRAATAKAKGKLLGAEGTPLFSWET